MDGWMDGWVGGWVGWVGGWMVDGESKVLGGISLPE
jgi:hypothetical protein